MSLLYWILMLLWLVFGVWSHWPSNKMGMGHVGLTFILFLLLGWQVFGKPIEG